MATSDLRRFYFYQDYIWTPDDFTNLQDWIYGSMQSVFEGAFGAAVLKGLVATPGGGLNLNISSGIAVGDNGEIMVSPTDLVANIPSPGGSNQNSLVVLRPTSTDMTDIPEPDNLSNTVPLHAKKYFEVVVLSKVPTFEGDYPTKQSGDCVVMGIRLLSGDTSIDQTKIDYSAVNRTRKRSLNVKKITGSYSVDPSVDEIIECDFSGASGVAQLPPAVSGAGMKVAVVKVDSSSNVASVSGYNAETISGQNAITLQNQWDTISIYSNGTAWRVL